MQDSISVSAKGAGQRIAVQQPNMARVARIGYSGEANIIIGVITKIGGGFQQYEPVASHLATKDAAFCGPVTDTTSAGIPGGILDNDHPHQGSATFLQTLKARQQPIGATPIDDQGAYRCALPSNFGLIGEGGLKVLEPRRIKVLLMHLALIN